MELTFKAWAVRPEGLGGFANSNDTPLWLNGAYAGAAYTLNATNTEPFWNMQFLAWPGPEFRTGQPAQSRWVQVTGHFDDPAASSCRKYGPVEDPNTPSAWPFFDVVACRQHFVLTAATPANGP
jgi:hypothetical protein